MEKWKDIEGYEGLYQVSNLGRVKSLNYLRTGKEKILKGYKIKGGYLQLYLSKKGKLKKCYIHRLVAQTFIPNPNNYPMVNHKDENKTNNCVDNLEWCSREYNTNYGTRNKRVATTKSIPILQFSKEGNFIRKWDSTKQVEIELGINNSNICMCCKGKYKSANGYVWGYEKEYERIPFKVFDLEIYRKIS